MLFLLHFCSLCAVYHASDKHRYLMGRPASGREATCKRQFMLSSAVNDACNGKKMNHVYVVESQNLV